MRVEPAAHAQALRRGNSGSPLTTAARPGSRPSAASAGSRGGRSGARPARSGARSPPPSTGMAGATRTRRSAAPRGRRRGRRRPPVRAPASRARRPRARRWPRRSAARSPRAPRAGRSASHASPPPRRTRPRTAASGAGRVGRGPDPAALGARPRSPPAATRLPRLFARSALYAGHDALVGEVAVAAERHARAAGGSGRRRRRSRRSATSGAMSVTLTGLDVGQPRRPSSCQLLPTHEQEAVHEDVGRRVDARGHAHRRPPHAVEPEDVLADQMVHRRPPRCEALVVGRRSRPRSGS